MMKQSFKSMMLMGAFMFSLLLCLTSCEDVLGHWEKPTPVTPTPTPTPEPEPEPTPTPGLLAGKFKINADGDQVQFSKGNLRYVSGTWSFFDNQYDYYTTYSADSWDKFGWSTSANTFGKSISIADGDYSGDFVDWGATMGSGWRTLTKDEWTYLFNNHTKGWATVNGVNGYVIRPDGITTAVEATYDATAWATEETNGAVFLPAAGLRNGTGVSFTENGYYWSSSPKDASYAYRVKFSSTEMNPADNSGNRYFGHSVRLVRDAE